MAQPPILKTQATWLRKGSSREGDPGALHRCGHAVGVYGADTWRGHSVGMMKETLTAQAWRLYRIVLVLASSALVLQAGQRWH
jgi:hypothetical protein